MPSSEGPHAVGNHSATERILLGSRDHQTRSHHTVSTPTDVANSATSDGAVQMPHPTSTQPAGVLPTNSSSPAQHSAADPADPLLRPRVGFTQLLMHQLSSQPPCSLQPLPEPWSRTTTHVPLAPTQQPAATQPPKNPNSISVPHVPATCQPTLGRNLVSCPPCRLDP